MDLDIGMQFLWATATSSIESAAGREKCWHLDFLWGLVRKDSELGSRWTPPRFLRIMFGWFIAGLVYWARDRAEDSGEFVTECWQLSFLLYFFFLCFSSQLDLNRLVSQLVGFSIISSCWERKGDCILKCRIKLLNILLDTAPTPTWLLNIPINVRTFNPKPKRRVEMPQCLQWLLYCSFGPGFLTSIIS